MKKFEKLFFILLPSGATIDLLIYLYLPQASAFVGIATFATMSLAAFKLNTKSI